MFINRLAPPNYHIVLIGNEIPYDIFAEQPCRYIYLYFTVFFSIILLTHLYWNLQAVKSPILFK